MTAFLKTDSGTSVECWEIGGSDEERVQLDTSAHSYALVFRPEARIDWAALGVSALDSSTGPSYVVHMSVLQLLEISSRSDNVPLC